jgi:hypothetical protein
MRDSIGRSAEASIPKEPGAGKPYRALQRLWGNWHFYRDAGPAPLVLITSSKIGAIAFFLGLTLMSCAPQPISSATPSSELALFTSTPEPATKIPPTPPVFSTSTPVPTSTSLPTPTMTPAPTPTEIALQPGSYNDGLLSIAVNDDVVTGFYENYTGWDEKLQAPRFGCLFFFAGRIRNSKVEIASSHTKGTIELLENDKVKINLEEEPNGCWNVEPRFDEEGVIFELTERQEWKFIRIVSSERAYFYNSPDETEREKSYVIKGEVLRIFDLEGDWVRAEYRGSQGITTGWIKESDLCEINIDF